KASRFAAEGRVCPLTLRTYCSAEARISSSVAGGSKWKRTLMFRHMTAGAWPDCWRASRVGLATWPMRAVGTLLLGMFVVAGCGGADVRSEARARARITDTATLMEALLAAGARVSPGGQAA